jgi:hypothetical protein
MTAVPFFFPEAHPAGESAAPTVSKITPAPIHFFISVA